ncbi:hypothetical protein CDAR_618381 [Caerostris darwini]|uniref:Uncharacterized protein n=1 Tax=Caerostris darwini TaxID=1538125 RepID=A0AAV4SWP6_9ARAC|nr:hypothetical protein CDAR_618381 [Caerostris darwini]
MSNSRSILLYPVGNHNPIRRGLRAIFRFHCGQNRVTENWIIASASAYCIHSHSVGPWIPFLFQPSPPTPISFPSFPPHYCRTLVGGKRRHFCVSIFQILCPSGTRASIRVTRLLFFQFLLLSTPPGRREGLFPLATWAITWKARTLC